MTPTQTGTYSSPSGQMPVVSSYFVQYTSGLQLKVPSLLLMGRLRRWLRKCQLKHVKGLCCVHLCWRNNGHCSVLNSFKQLKQQGKTTQHFKETGFYNDLYLRNKSRARKKFRDSRVSCYAASGVAFCVFWVTRVSLLFREQTTHVF